MNIIVTGGSGFIGTNWVIKRLEDYPEDRILNLDKLTYAANEVDIQDDRYTHQQVDICSSEIPNIIEKFNPDAVIHFAAESHVDNSIENPSDFINTNIIGTFNLLKSCQFLINTNPLFKFLHVSTDEVYGSLGSEGQFIEETPYDPRSPYSASKASSDHLVRAYFHTYGFPGIITNCSNNYGPYQHKEKFIPKIITNILSELDIPVYGKGNNIRDWLYVEDHCDALNIVLEKGEPGETYNIGGDCEKKNIDIVKDITSLLGGAHLVTFVKDRLGHDFRYAIDHSKITKELGWVPNTDYSVGIRKTIEFYKKNTRD